MDPLTLSLIGGVVSSAASGAGTLLDYKLGRQNQSLTREQNALNRQTEADRYVQMRRDARYDWNLQNAYNHPAEQMNRLRQAGLNPNLVYGKGADATAESLRASSFGNVNAPPPTMDVLPGRGIAQFGSAINQGIQGIYDLKAKQAQVDNTAQQTALMQQDALLKQANTAKTIQDTARSKFELGKAQELKDYVIEAQKLQNEKTKADTIYTLDQNQRQELANSSNVRLTMEKIITEKIAHAKDQATIDLLKGQLDQLRQNMDIATYEQKLTEMGIHKNDPYWYRGFFNLMDGNIQMKGASNAVKKMLYYKNLKK